MSLLAAFRDRLRGASVTPPVAPVPAAAPRAEHPDLDYPELNASHFAAARAFADRTDMLLALRPETGLVFGEVGVGLGNFSRFVIERMRPSRFIAIDIFYLHTLAELWGKPTAEWFGGKTHRAFYADSLAFAGDALVIEEGESHARLAAMPDASFDILYIDADHTYESVRRDAAAALPKLKPDGLLVFNDYTLHDHAGTPYGVIRAVNELVVATDWKVVGFSLQRLMYCDIALRRVGAA